MWHHAFHDFIHNNTDKGSSPILSIKPMIIKVDKINRFYAKFKSLLIYKQQ